MEATTLGSRKHTTSSWVRFIKNKQLIATSETIVYALSFSFYDVTILENILLENHREAINLNDAVTVSFLFHNFSYIIIL